MHKAPKKTCVRCEKHEFSLKPKGDYVVQGQHFAISFCKESSYKYSKKNPKPRDSLCLDCPLFNYDTNYATPTFILDSQKNYYDEQGRKLKQEHQKKMTSYTDERSELNIPKPRSKNSFCSVCRQNYDDYLQHIESLPHKKRIHQSNFNKDILQLSNKFVDHHTSSMANTRNPGEITTKVTTLNQSDDDEVVFISNPNKKIKANEPFTINDYNVKNPTYPTKMQMPWARQGTSTQDPLQVNFKPQTWHNSYQQKYSQLTFNYHMNFIMNPYPFFPSNNYSSFMNYGYPNPMNPMNHMNHYLISFNIERNEHNPIHQLPIPANQPTNFIVIDE